jgi:hypothetical protein
MWKLLGCQCTVKLLLVYCLLLLLNNVGNFEDQLQESAMCQAKGFSRGSCCRDPYSNHCLAPLHA